MKNVFSKYYRVKSIYDGPFCAFDNNWFIKYQVQLLLLLNLPIIKIIIRRLFKINKLIKYNDEIIEVTPNDFKVFVSESNSDVKIKGFFYTHNKFSKRVYYNLRLWWWFLHGLDEIFKNDLLPELNFGFDTLTAYSVPGTTASGYVQRGANSGYDETFSTIRNGSGTSSSATSTTFSLHSLVSSATTNQFKIMTRGLFVFDTSSLTSSATISSATINIYGSSKLSNLGSPSTYIVSSSPASTSSISDSDYSNLGTTSFASQTYANFSTTSYNVFNLDANGISNISKVGVSKFGSRSSWDNDNSFGGTWGNTLQTHCTGRAGSYTGTSYDPYIEIVYTLPATGKKWNGATASKWNGITPSKINSI